MSEMVLRAVFGRTGLAICPLIKNRAVVPRKALEIKKLERRRDIFGRLQVRHLLLNRQDQTSPLPSGAAPHSMCCLPLSYWAHMSIPAWPRAVTALSSLLAPAVNLIWSHMTIKLQLCVYAKYSLIVFKAPLHCCPELENTKNLIQVFIQRIQPWPKPSL